MCLDDYDFPLPAVGRDLGEDIQKRERHIKERTREKGEQQWSFHILMYCLSPGQYWLSNIFSGFPLLIDGFVVHHTRIDHGYDFPKWAVGGG